MLAKPDAVFHTLRHLRSNARRLEHLALLDLPVRSRSVLEVGAGIGDLTPFFLDRQCTVTSSEPQASNVERFRERYAGDALWPSAQLAIVQSDIEHLAENGVGAHDIVFCYSTINQLGDPDEALRALAALCGDVLILEAATSSGSNYREDTITFYDLDPNDPAGSISGRACRPTRPWVFNRLGEHFSHVYMPLIQPQFDRFRRDWREPATGRQQHRAIFVASRSPIENAYLVERIPDLHLD